MRNRLIATASTALAAVLLGAGCTAAPTNDAAEGRQGTEREVAEVIDDLSAAAVEGDANEVCETLFAPEVAARLGDGAGCEDAVSDQLSDVSDGEIEVESIEVDGDEALARVVTPYGERGDLEQTIELTRVGNAWRIAGITEPVAQSDTDDAGAPSSES